MEAAWRRLNTLQQKSTLEINWVFIHILKKDNFALFCPKLTNNVKYKHHKINNQK